MAQLADTHGGLHGGAAVVAQPGALDALARVRADGQAALGTPGMVAAYDAQLGPALTEASARITDHALRQSEVERRTVADQAMQAAQQSAASAWRDPLRFIKGLDAVRALAGEQVGPHASAEGRIAAERQAVGGSVAGAVDQALCADEPEFAAHIMALWGHAMTPAAYQHAVARISQAAQDQHIAAIFAEAAGGNAVAGDAQAAPKASSPYQVVLSAPPGAAVHPVAPGAIVALTGPDDCATVQIIHSDGSIAVYGRLGLAAVAPGDLVSPAHAIGSATAHITLAACAASGAALDAANLLRDAGGHGAVIGSGDTPRRWNVPVMLDRIAARADLTSEDRVLAAAFARRRMEADHATQAASTQAAGRSVVALFAAAPRSTRQAADLPSALAAQMTPATLAQVDRTLRDAGHAASVPVPENPAALRLELLQRKHQGEFSRLNLALLIGMIDAADLVRLGDDQTRIVAGKEINRPDSRGAAVLDALARHEIVQRASLPDDVLPAIKASAETLLRLNRTDPADQPAIDAIVATAIQSPFDRG